MDVDEFLDRTMRVFTLYAEWPLRVVFAAVFLFHGSQKFSGGLNEFADATGISVGLVALVAIMEITSGILVILGGINFVFHATFTRIGAALAIPVLIGAIVLYHWPQWRFEPSTAHPLGGMEFQVSLILVALYLIASAGRIREHEPSKRVKEVADMDTRARVFIANLPTNAHWFLRIALATVFFTHGLTKFDTLESFSQDMGLWVPFSFLLAMIECTIGILVLLGGSRTEYADAASRIAGFLVIPVMLGAIFKVHLGRWDFGATTDFPLGGMEFQTLLLAIGLFFLMRGRPALVAVKRAKPTGA